MIDLLVDGQFDWRAFLADLPPNIVGAVITFWLLDWAFNRRRQNEERLEMLIQQMGDTKDNATALRAVNELKRRGWLSDGSLKKADFRGANLAGARLNNANLEGANLNGANLQRASLGGVNLKNAKLLKTDMTKAFLNSAYLQGAILGGAKLQGANLAWAKLHGAYLKFEINGLIVYHSPEAEFDQETVLPNGKNWDQTTKVDEFTQRDYPDYGPDYGESTFLDGNDMMEEIFGM